MKRWIWLLFALGMPLSSPLACGGDGCLRNSDCPSDQTCRVGRCELKELPGGEGGAGEEPSAGRGGVTSGGATNRAGTPGSGGVVSGGSSGSAGTESPGGAGGATIEDGGASNVEGGAAGSGESSAGAASDAGASLGGSGEPTP